jgi:hypothetical protein
MSKEDLNMLESEIVSRLADKVDRKLRIANAKQDRIDLRRKIKQI